VSAFSEHINQLIESSYKLRSSSDFDNWRRGALAFLHVTDPDCEKEFAAHEVKDTLDWGKNIHWYRGLLEGYVVRVLERESALAGLESLAVGQIGATSAPRARISLKVFIVHGHDDGAKESAARFVSLLGLEPVILHEQPNEGRTVIEKFEGHADVGFAVILLTPDDVGGAKGDAANLRMRARQNVVLELGYFLGSLKRSRVCALYKKGVEIPSDVQGVLYVEMDEGGGWRAKLAREISSAGLPIDPEALLKSS